MKFKIIHKEDNEKEIDNIFYKNDRWDKKDSYTQKELLILVRNTINFNYSGVNLKKLKQHSWLLDRCCHHWGERYVDYNLEKERFCYFGVKRLCDLMIIDSYGRIVNLQDLALRAWNYEIPKEKPWIGSHYDPSAWWEDSWWWTLQVKRCKHPFMNYNYRSVKTQQERKISFDLMHKPFVRGKRRSYMLDPWGMLERSNQAQITWKQMKIKRQWEEHCG